MSDARSSTRHSNFSINVKLISFKISNWFLFQGLFAFEITRPRKCFSLLVSDKIERTDEFFIKFLKFRRKNFIYQLPTPLAHRNLNSTDFITELKAHSEYLSGAVNDENNGEFFRKSKGSNHKQIFNKNSKLHKLKDEIWQMP